MKKIIAAFIFLHIFQVAPAQKVIADTVAYDDQLEVLNRRFSNLPENKAVKELEVRYKIEIISIGACLSLLGLGKDLALDSLTRGMHTVK